MFAMFCLLFISLVVSQIHAQDDFKITSPEVGDTVTVGKTTTDDISVPILWTVPEAIADRPVFITLVHGSNVSSLERIDLITSTAPNNGSYTWRGDVFDSALVYGYSHGAPSACDYSIELKVWTDVIYSGYFTIINPEDGGLNSTSECPSGDSAVGPTNLTYTSDGDSSDSTASSTSSGTSASATSTSTTSVGSEKGAEGGVSTTTLAIAVAIPIVVLLLAFGVIIWLGRRRGWFVKRNSGGDRNNAVGDKSNVVTQTGGSKVPGNNGESGFLSVRELHANDLPHRLEGSPIHELQGGEGGQQYGVRN